MAVEAADFIHHRGSISIRRMIENLSAATVKMDEFMAGGPARVALFESCDNMVHRIRPYEILCGRVRRPTLPVIG